MRVLVRSASGKAVLHGNGVVNSITLFLSHTHTCPFSFTVLDDLVLSQEDRKQRAKGREGFFLYLVLTKLCIFFGKNRSVFYEFI
jgi:hypothetical protein